MVCMVPFQSETSKYPASAGYFIVQTRAIGKDFKTSESEVCVFSPLSSQKSAQWCQKVPLRSVTKLFG